ncbi:MAG: aromatic ring-hydroxylating dioxygenase subunit alpha, partial [Elusimicrobia bacterium]|nr:aromatic ring-hydroxylating dioxygenase subunit alpha [Elusimicrobiota bacterium]
VEAMAQVRRGARSGLAPRGRFSPAEETGPHWFHRAVSRALLGR